MADSIGPRSVFLENVAVKEVDDLHEDVCHKLIGLHKGVCFFCFSCYLFWPVSFLDSLLNSASVSCPLPLSDPYKHSCQTLGDSVQASPSARGVQRSLGNGQCLGILAILVAAVFGERCEVKRRLFSKAFDYSWIIELGGFLQFLVVASLLCLISLFLCSKWPNAWNLRSFKQRLRFWCCSNRDGSPSMSPIKHQA